MAAVNDQTPGSDTKNPDNRRVSTPHWEALTPATMAAFNLLPELGFIGNYYLAGGTGLAIHFGHRISVDLDLFSDRSDSVNPVERSAIRSVFNGPNTSIVYDVDTTFVTNWQGTSVSFFRHDMYPLVTPTLLINHVPIASILEIGAMKLSAIIGRGTRKDLVDLYFILQENELEKVFEVAAIKYAKISTFAVSAIRALAYFHDADVLPMPRMLDTVPADLRGKRSWNEMKKFLNAKSIEAGRKQLGDLWEGNNP